jgi:hypothetical protein
VEPSSEDRVSEGLVPLLRCSPWNRILKTELRKTWCHRVSMCHWVPPGTSVPPGADVPLGATGYQCATGCHLVPRFSPWNP